MSHFDFDVNLTKYEYSWHGAYSRASPVAVLLRPEEHAKHPARGWCFDKRRVLFDLMVDPDFDWTAISFRLGEGMRAESLPVSFESAAPSLHDSFDLGWLIAVVAVRSSCHFYQQDSSS
eukprot:TRINITY_DN5370_c0_g1_i12.p1 TRINITY_DN5370_c0_g1~~TRINITY_DN5370_c0_g1_i12.p1  ORF type:complete len:119 (-),score=7.01 TRINITY_DN5370_c0_g1_i12:57-413(-)